MVTCNCNLSLLNTGTPNCEPIASVTKKLIIVPLYAEDQTKNRIDLINDTLDETYVSGKINETDSSKRWYVTDILENVEDVRADSVIESLNSGANIKVQDGNRTFTGFMIKRSATYMSKISAAGCFEIGVYIIDKDANLIGSIDGDYLDPIEVNNDSWDVGLVKTTDTTVQKVEVNFDYSQVEKDEDLRLILSSEWGGYNLLNARGLLDVNATISSTGQTEMVVDLKLDYGSAITKRVVKGWVLADFSLYNNTTTSAVTITLATENPDGTYTLTYASQTLADSLTLSGSKTGYEMADVTGTVA